ncbi:helix-turn-helix domain-containing protein [Aeromicrobium panaciterrae]|uniref:PucR family transcriptional regulator n=1 Tax=Aeromicrobium panaciterrae TaxID=363861 RepID=UPI0031DC96F5
MAKAERREDIVEVLDQLREEMPSIAKGVVREIRANLVEYSVVPLGDHVEHVTEQLTRIVDSLREGRQLTDEDLRRAGALGRLRATQGVSVEAVMGAWHVGNRELWKIIDERADRGRSFLPGLATLLWDSMQMTSTELAASHSSVSRAQHTQDLTLRHRLMALLSREEVGPEAEEVAASLGFDVAGEYVAACISAGERPIGVAQTLHEELEYLDGVSFAVQQGAVLMVLAQGPSAKDVVEVIDGLGTSPTAGVGLERAGLRGAQMSIEDARLCLESVGGEQRVRAFGDDWWRASLMAESERLAPLVVERREAIEENPHLVETIEQFMTSGFSVTAAAKALQIHANSVAYRLDRWHQLTGWDPRTFIGLNQSLLGCALVQSGKISGT